MKINLIYEMYLTYKCLSELYPLTKSRVATNKRFSAARNLDQLWFQLRNEIQPSQADLKFESNSFFSDWTDIGSAQQIRRKLPFVIAYSYKNKICCKPNRTVLRVILSCLYGH